MASLLLAARSLAAHRTRLGLTVVALTVYMATMSRRGEYGVVKALGGSNFDLYRVVVLPALMVGGLLKPTSGSIRLDGQEITSLGERRLPAVRLHRIGFVFQDFNLLSAVSVRENVALVAMMAGASRREAARQADEALSGMGLGSRLRYRPENLSGVEKQRVAIARSLINDPALILADEPTANLDSRIGHEIARLLREIAKQKGKSVVVVSHDQRLREHADRVLWLEDGRFKQLSAMVVDPVCGMALEADKTVRLELDGQVHRFCSRGCRAEFLEGAEGQEVSHRESARYPRGVY